MVHIKRFFLVVSLLLITIVGAPTISTQANTHRYGTATTPIQHVVFILQANHTFDNFFGTFPGANGISEPEATNPQRVDLDHSGSANIAALDGGKLDEVPARGHVHGT